MNLNNFGTVTFTIFQGLKELGIFFKKCVLIS